MPSPRSRTRAKITNLSNLIAGVTSTMSDMNLDIDFMAEAVKTAVDKAEAMGHWRAITETQKALLADVKKTAGWCQVALGGERKERQAAADLVGKVSEVNGIEPAMQAIEAGGADQAMLARVRVILGLKAAAAI